MAGYAEYPESVAAINAGVTYTVPIPESFLKHGAGNALVISFSESMVEEINVIINGNSWGLFGAGGFLVVNPDDKKYIQNIKLTNTSATNTSNDEIKILLRRVV
jgi:hypothetical protein